jgi:hypothetical protein
MTNRTWTNGGTDSFNDPAAWTPDGAPESGDVLTVVEGNPDATDLTLQGLTIGLGANTGIPFSPLGYLPSPVLTLDGSTIGAGTTIVLAAVFRPIVFPAVHDPVTLSTYPAVDQGTLLVTGPNNPASSLTVSTNDGTIETAASGLFAAAGTLTLDIGVLENSPDSFTAEGYLVNNGVIDASVGSTILLEGPTPFFYPGQSLSGMTNDGTIDVSGTVNDVAVDISGTGTINLESSPGYLGLPAEGEFILSNTYYPAPSIGSGQNFVFNGGELVLNPQLFGAPIQAIFQGTLSNFGSTPGNTIELQDFILSSASYSAGVLALNGSETPSNPDNPPSGTYQVTDTLKFSGLPRLGHFVFSESAGNTDMTWNSLPFIHLPV